MDDAMTEAMVGAGWERLGMKIGLDIGGRHTGAIVLDDELHASGNDGEGDADLPGSGDGKGRDAGQLAANGLGCIAHEIDGDALDDFGGEVEGRKRDLAGDGDVRGAGGDAPEDGRKAEQHGGVVGAIGADVGGAGTAGAKEFGGTNGCVSGAERRDIAEAGSGCGQQAMDEPGAAVGDEAQFGGVVLVFGTQDAGDMEEIAVEAEGGEEVSGVVGEATGFGEGGCGRGGWVGWEQR